jgi:hypothetical protein
MDGGLQRDNRLSRPRAAPREGCSPNLIKVTSTEALLSTSVCHRETTVNRGWWRGA